MAAMYGRGASYDAIEGQFRKYRRAAEQLKSEAAANGVTVPPRGRNTGAGGTPRTPRGPRSKNGVTNLPHRAASRASSMQKSSPLHPRRAVSPVAARASWTQSVLMTATRTSAC
jgi:hypothetical protein